MIIKFLPVSFSSMLDIDKLILVVVLRVGALRFSSMLDIDKLILPVVLLLLSPVLVLCWILIN